MGETQTVMATIYCNQMSGAWRNRCAKEEQQLLQNIAPHLFPDKIERAPAHHNAPFACEPQATSRSRDTACPTESRSATRTSTSRPNTTRKPSSRSTHRSERPDTAATNRTSSTATSVRSDTFDRRGQSSLGTAGMPSDHELQRKLASLEAQVENERVARRKMEAEVKQLRSEVGSSRPSTSATARSRTSTISIA